MSDLSKMRELADKWLKGTITEDEKQEFEYWYNAETGNTLEWKGDASEEELRQRLLAVLMARIDAEEIPIITIPSQRRIIFRRIAVAASILIILAASSYFLFFNHQSKNNLASTNINTITHDVTPPVSTHAVITLADGRQVVLDSAKNGSLAVQGNVNVIKTTDGKIVYSSESALRQAQGDKSQELKYNTLANPRGSPVIDMTLADGSHVWLNAGSSVRYPVAFVGNERKVSISGEAYFEVTHDASKPFIVGKGDMNVTVLGTHFNVNAYDDEPGIKVTLLKGSVKVNNDADSKMIKPGEQIVAVSHLPFTINHSADINEVMAWKNGLFRFERADIGTVMRQIARWYDVDVEYQGKVNEHFGGTISRDVNASKVFEMLEMTGGVKFKIDGKKVTVIP